MFLYLRLDNYHTFFSDLIMFKPVSCRTKLNLLQILDPQCEIIDPVKKSILLRDWLV